jgi:hypothetical protein
MLILLDMLNGTEEKIHRLMKLKKKKWPWTRFVIEVEMRDSRKIWFANNWLNSLRRLKSKDLNVITGIFLDVLNEEMTYEDRTTSMEIDFWLL